MKRLLDCAFVAKDGKRDRNEGALHCEGDRLSDLTRSSAACLHSYRESTIRLHAAVTATRDKISKLMATSIPARLIFLYELPPLHICYLDDF